MDWFIDLARALLGLGVLIGILWLLSVARGKISWRLVGVGIGLQALLAVLVLKVPFVSLFLETITRGVTYLLGFSQEGAAFIFGDLATDPSFGAIFAFQVLPTIIFFAALTSVLYYLGVLQRIVWGFAWLMQRTMRLSGSESLAAAANIFVGQTEAPLFVKPYVAGMTKSEMLCLMTGGMATIAGGVFAAFIAILGGDDPAQQVKFGKHLLTASLLSAPAAIVCAKLLWPESGEVRRDLTLPPHELGSNLFDAAMQGTSEGVRLALNVGAALIVFIAFIAMFNFVSESMIGEWTGLNATIAEMSGGRYEGLTLQFLFGLIFAPVAWLIGVDGGSLMPVGQLLGEKLVLNEFVAYNSLQQAMANGVIVDEKAILIATYALCGFANFSSMGIQIGGISVLAPDQRGTIAALAPRALIGGTVACLMTAAVAGVFL